MSDEKFIMCYHDGAYKTQNHGSWDGVRAAYDKLDKGWSRAVVHQGRIVFAWFYNEEWRNNICNQMGNPGVDFVPEYKSFQLHYHWNNNFHTSAHNSLDEARKAFDALDIGATRVVVGNGMVYFAWLYNEEWRDRLFNQIFANKFKLVHHTNGKYHCHFFDNLDAARDAYNKVSADSSRCVTHNGRVLFCWHWDESWYQNIRRRIGWVENEAVNHHNGQYFLVYHWDNKYHQEKHSKFEGARDAIAKVDKGASRAVFQNGRVVQAWFYNHEWRNNIINAAK